MAGVGLFNVVFFQWLRVSLLRFFPAHRHEPRPLLMTVVAGYAAGAVLTGGVGLLVAALWPDPAWRGLILLAVPSLWTLAWFDLTLELFRIQLRPLQYGLMAWLKAGAALGGGVLLVRVGLGASGPLLGIALGALLAGFVGRRDWRRIHPRVDPSLLRQLLRYGLPLTAAFALGFVISTSDRFLIAWSLGEGPAGIYAAAYDLSQQSLGLLAMTVTLAAYPLVVRTLEKDGQEEARVRLRQNATLLLGLAVPAWVGIAMLAPNIARVFLGTGFREQGTAVLPWIALAAVLASLKSYHFDVAFHLGRNTLGLIWVSGVAAAANLVLNLWWIPSLGLLGAALATVASYLLALFMSMGLGRRTFRVPFPMVDAGKVILASAVMALVLWRLAKLQGAEALVLQVLVGGATYGLAALGLNVGHSRRKLVALLWNRCSSQE
jgi:O-antigen/teichoic acid export membrane protein